MSFNNGPTIVTNGLVLALDAGDRNSYVSGSNTWFDLTGANNGTLTNGPTFNSGSGGSIVFDGTNDGVSTNFNSALGDFTICAWFKWGGGIIRASFPYGLYIGPFSENVWNFISMKRQGTIQTLYANGIDNTVSQSVTSGLLSTDALTIGYGGSQYMSGSISIIQIYNRALSASEVLQNYNATKGRFGL